MINLLLAFSLLSSTCSDVASGSDKILIVYLSRTNNTKTIAEIIHKNVGGKLVALELEKPYPENYQAIVQQVVHENETEYLPPLKTKIDSIEKYDVVFIGFPTWGMKLPPPVKTFLKQYDLSGKTVIPFNTNAGFGTGSSFDTVKELCKKSKVLEGFSMKGGIERDGQYLVIKGETAIEAKKNVMKWLKKLKVIRNDTLSRAQQNIIRIAAFAAKGELTRLKTVVSSGLDAGLTINQVKEVMVHLYAYCGFPRSIRGLQTLMAVVDERKAKGIKDEWGPEATPVKDDRSKYERGKEILGKLTGISQEGPKTGYAAFSPEIEVFLKEHLFADIFERDVLSYAERELVTVAVLGSIGGVEPMLNAHLNICLNVGITPNQLKQFAGILKSVVDEDEAKATRSITATPMPRGQGTQKEQNPYSLVYDGAITKNVKGQVNIHPVSYTINDIKIVANVYTPSSYNPAGKYPTIVIAHPNGGVKEQVAGLYAQRLAEQGYITITADAAYQGGSGGAPRYVDKPANRIEDIYAMGDFISRFPGVDKSKLGLLGICGGGGYSLKAAQSDKRFKAIATVSMFNSGVVRRNGFMNSQLSTIQERLKQASNARASEAAGGEILYANNNTTPLTDEQIAKLPFDLYREGYIYYGKTHAHPNSSGRYTLSSLMDLMTFDASTNMDLISQPLLMIAGSKADSYYMTDDAFGKAVNSKNKELFLINGATHIETYWKPGYVSQALNKLTSFYQTNL